MFRIHFIFALFVIMLALNTANAREPGPGEGTYVTFYYTVDVFDQNNAPVSGIEVKLFAFYYLQQGTEILSEYVTATGYTNSQGHVLLVAQAEVTGYWPNNYAFNMMEVFVMDQDYSILSSQNTSSFFPSATGSFQIVYDRDGDLLDDNFEQMLAEKFSPVLHKHSFDKQQNLESMERLISGGYLTLKSYNLIGQSSLNIPITGGDNGLHKWDPDEEWHWDSYGFGSQNTIGNYNIDIANSQRYVGAPVGQRPLYYHVYKDGSLTYVQYWYFFGMNDITDQLPSIADTKHEGDWEHVSIRLIGDINPTPLDVNFYQHEGGETRPAEKCWWSSTNTLSYSGMERGYSSNRTHLHIWISANSHASYNRFSESKANYNWLIGLDFYDHLDFFPQSYDLYFEYDYLTKLGEVKKLTSSKCPDSGATLAYHVYPIKFSKHWLAYVGRIGEWFDPPAFFHFPSPQMPAVDVGNHEWKDFTYAGDGFFGNHDSYRKPDDTAGD